MISLLSCAPLGATFARVRTVSLIHQKCPYFTDHPLLNSRSVQPLITPSNANVSIIIKKLFEIVETKDIQFISEHPAIEICLKKLSQFSDNEVVQVVHVMNNLYRGSFGHEVFRNEILRRMLHRLDAECGHRASRRWSLPFMIDLLENNRMFYRIRGKSKSKFLNLFSAHRFDKAFQLEPQLLVRYLQIVNESYYWKVANKVITCRYNFEFALEKYFNDFTLADLGVIFRAHNTLSFLTPVMYINRDELLPQIFEKVLNNIAQVDKTFLKDFLFFINRQIFLYTYPQMTPPVIRFIDYLEENSNDIPLECLCYASKLCTKFLLYRPALLEKILFRLTTEYSFQFIDAFEQAVRCMAFFNFHSRKADVYSELLNFLKREEIKTKFLLDHPKRFARIIAYLSYVGLYSNELVNLLLSNDFLRKTYKKLGHHAVHRHILRLDFGMGIECPSYVGNRLAPDFREKFANFLVDNHPKNCYRVDHIAFENSYKMFPSEHACNEHVLYNRTMEDASYILNDILGGDEYTHVCRILPHWPGKNLIFCTGTDKTARKLTPTIKGNQRLDLQELDENFWWFALVCSSRNKYGGGKPMVVGKEIPKVRQLKRLGFRILNVVHEDWELMTGDEKSDLLRKQISES